jgi:hypothetical protein
MVAGKPFSHLRLLIQAQNCASRVLGVALAALVVGCGRSGVGLRTATLSAPTVVASDSPSHHLRVLSINDSTSGIVFRIYHDSISGHAARSAIPTLLSMYREVGRMAGADPAQVHWHAVVFLRQGNPWQAAGETRWPVEVDGSGAVTAVGADFLYRVVPHEQVHAVQNSFSPGLPRWFAEGQATWIGLRITSNWRTALAEGERLQLSAAQAASTTGVDLRNWGGLRPKREAIMRQVDPVTRSRMQADSGYFPTGSFAFGPDDIESDESNARARYSASAEIMSYVCDRAGEDGLVAWFRAVWAHRSRDTDQLIQLAREHAGVDLAERL